MLGPCTTRRAGSCGACGNRDCFTECAGPRSGAMSGTAGRRLAAAMSGIRFDILGVFYKEMGLSRLTHGIQQGFMHGKKFLAQAYTEGKKFLSHLDNYAGIARGVIGAVAPVVGQLSGPVGQAVGAAVGGGMQALGQYDRLKMEAMNQGNQVANVGAAIKRGMG